jgi:hypothetical protein
MLHFMPSNPAEYLCSCAGFYVAGSNFGSHRTEQRLEANNPVPIFMFALVESLGQWQARLFQWSSRTTVDIHTISLYMNGRSIDIDVGRLKMMLESLWKAANPFSCRILCDSLACAAGWS